MKIIFTTGYKVKDAEGAEYKRGDTLECSQATRDHFVNRGVAKDAAAIGSKSKATPKKESKETPDTDDAPKVKAGSK